LTTIGIDDDTCVCQILTAAWNAALAAVFASKLAS
jgi:hypothetical protein